MRLRKLWRTYGPTFRWQHFRLYGDPPNSTYQPLAVTQLVGGRRWSLSLTRSGDYVKEDQ